VSDCALHTIHIHITLGLMAWMYKRGTRYWIGWRHNGKQFLKPTGETIKEEAEKQLRDLKLLENARTADALTEDFFRVVTGKQIKVLTLADFLKQWLSEAERTTAPNTMTKYRQVVREFSKQIGAEASGIRLDEVTSVHIHEFLLFKQQQSAPGTVKGFKRILSSIFLQAQNLGYIRGNPVALVREEKRKEKEQKVKRPFTIAEVKDLHARANAFWQYMIHAAFYTGQSLGDLVTLKPDNVDLAQNVVRITRRKTGTRVIVPLAKSFRNLLVKLTPKNRTEFYWPKEATRYLTVGASSFSQEFYELMTSAGMVVPRKNKQAAKKGRAAKREHQALGFHNLRHTFITNLKIAGAVDSVAKELAGHGSTAINTVYTHLPVETLATAVNQLPEFVN
jgi:integrase